MYIQKDKRQNIKLILHKQKSSIGKYNENLDSFKTIQTISKKNSNQHSSMHTSSQFSTLFNKKMSAKNHTHNLFSTLMKPKQNTTKNHHISCHHINSHLEPHKLSTLNISSKNIINNSIDSPDNFSSDKAIFKLKKENHDLLAKAKQQEKTISDILSQNKKIEAKFNASEQKRRKMKDEMNVLKANEAQLMTILYVLEEKGIRIEEIIDKWNSENEPSENNRTDDSAAFTPITLEKQPKCFTKIDNIPKLNFNMIKANSIQKNNDKNDDIQIQNNNNNNNDDKGNNQKDKKKRSNSQE